jgi:hypothetical protein
MAGITLTWLPVLIDRGVIARVAELHALAESARPWFVPEHALLLYVWTPVVVASGTILCLSPGLLLALAVGQGGDVGRWVLHGLALGIPVLSVASAAIQALLAEPLTGGAFVCVCIGLSAVLFVVVLSRSRRSPEIPMPFSTPSSRFTGCLAVGLPVLVLAVLTPKFHWECFNGDGIHAFESARLTLFQTFPFWPASIPDLAPFPDMTSVLFVFPTSWFVRLFGEYELAARAPFLLYLAALFGAILAVAEHGRPRPLDRVERSLVALGLAPYVLTMAFSATYHPYAADLALPATQDTLLLVVFLGFVLATLDGRLGAASGMLALTVLCSPSGPLLIVLFLLAWALLERPTPYRRALKLGAALALALVAFSVLPSVLQLVGLPVPGREYAGSGLIGRFRYLQFTDLGRLAFWLVPGGIVPALGFVAWRRLDPAARTLFTVSWVYAGVFYVQAFVSVHHFVPAMLLPLAAFWRTAPPVGTPRRLLLRAACAGGAIAAVFLSLPESSRLYTASREIGASVADREGDYDRMDFRAYRRSLLLLGVLPYDFDPSVPDASYGGNPHVWRYYAERARGESRDPNYLLLAGGEAPPAGFRLVRSDAAGALYLRSEAIHREHRAIRPPTPAGARVFRIPRSLLLKRPEAADARGIVDVKAILGLTREEP